ncbi:RSP14 protein, partial [Polyodon spathula]|nr:RSP14 protein [Polyodon spathula]
PRLVIGEAVCRSIGDWSSAKQHSFTREGPLRAQIPVFEVPANSDRHSAILLAARLDGQLARPMRGPEKGREEKRRPAQPELQRRTTTQLRVAYRQTCRQPYPVMLKVPKHAHVTGSDINSTVVTECPVPCRGDEMRLMLTYSLHVMLGALGRVLGVLMLSPVSLESNRKELILDTLHFCLCVDTSEALATETVSVLKEKLSHCSGRIRSKAARALMDISVPLEGKLKLCEEEVIPILVNLLGDPSPEVAASAAGALMSATVTTAGKYAALSADALPPLLGLVRSPQMSVCLNAVKAITVLAEAPEGRKELLKHLDLLEDLRGHDSEITRRAAETAMRVITWKP